MGSKAGDVAKNQSKKAAEKAIKKAGKKAGKAAAKGAASAASSGAASAAGITSLGAFFATPVGWVVLAIIIIILIIILVIGFIGFFETMPGLMMEKIEQAFDNFVKGVYENHTDDDAIQVSQSAQLELANYIDELGYDLEGYGFVTKATRDESRKNYRCTR